MRQQLFGFLGTRRGKIAGGVAGVVGLCCVCGVCSLVFGERPGPGRSVAEGEPAAATVTLLPAVVEPTTTTRATVAPSTSTPLPTSTPVVLDLTIDRAVWNVDYSRHATPSAERPDNEGCASFRFELDGSKPVYQYRELKSPLAQAYLQILKEGEIFEEYGPTQLRDMDQYGDGFFLVWRKECVHSRLIETADYDGMEFHLVLLYDNNLVAEFRGFKQGNGWVDEADQILE